ncbi:ATP-binding protein [Streptomyces sp. NPDC046197]|uniref:ATP-binding protein n=1 Tax=Streptomyces sp. NPDC046197 TaxID=3154337 RepID=UPI0033CE77D8
MPSDPADPRTTAALECDRTCIAEARRFAAEFLGGVRARRGLPVSTRAEEVTQLVVSELVTNARKHASGPVLLELRVAGDVVEVGVVDSDPALPVANGPDPRRVGRHGLEIVRAVSRGFDVRRGPLGKRVSARVALADEPPPVGRASA